MSLSFLRQVAKILAFAMMAGLSACTTVHVSGAKAEVKQGIGFVNVALQPDGKAPFMVTTEGVGIVGAANSIMIGAGKEFLVSFPDAGACHTVIVVQNQQQFESLRQLISSNPESLNHLCLTSKEKSAWIP
ncbi:MAG: hypothetical protein RL748_2900 [Pseudomonadota bacterium]|jgi:hypothetical protein